MGTTVTRLAFFQTGAEFYNYNQGFGFFTFGEGATVTDDFEKTCTAGTDRAKAKMYDSYSGVYWKNLTSAGQWWFAMGPNNGVNYVDSDKVPGDRGVVIRDFNARYGGLEVGHP